MDNTALNNLNTRILISLGGAKSMDIPKLEFKIAAYKEDFEKMAINSKIEFQSDELELYQSSIEKLQIIYESRTSRWFSGILRIARFLLGYLNL